MCPWSPLAGGFLTGKYQKSEEKKSPAGEGRLSGANPFGDTKFTERNWDILATLKTVAAEVDRPLAQVVLAWTLGRPGITSAIIGASKLDQVEDNLASLEIHFSSAQMDALNAGSVLDPSHPDGFFSPGLKQMIFGGNSVQGWE